MKAFITTLKVFFWASVSIVVVAIVLFTKQPPLKAINEAKNALKIAKESHADVLAADKYSAAKESLAIAIVEINQINHNNPFKRSYQDAVKILFSAKMLALEADSAASNIKAKQKAVYGNQQ